MEVQKPDTGENIRSIQVDKPLDVELDIGTLLVSDPNEVSLKELRSKTDEYIKSLTRGNTQLLVNKIWTIPFERVDDIVIVKLPKPKYILPREKPAPKAKALTKWQSYAKEKGISKRNKTKLVWDDLVNKWVPRFGYRRAEAEHEKDWVLEVPKNVDPMEDQFEKKSVAKSERVAKNELQRLKNIARSRKVQVPSAGLIPTERPTKNELHQSVHVAKKATASLGKFQKTLRKEKPLKNTGKKRQFEPLVQKAGTEKAKNLELLDKIMNKRPKINLEKAANMQMSRDETEEGETKRNNKKGGGRAGGRKSSKGKKGSANQGSFSKGSSNQGSFNKGRSSMRSRPKRKQH